MYDVIITNARIIDGTAAPFFYGDLAVSQGKIVRISRKIEADAKEVFDAKGFYVCPGFIDAHSHSDFPLLANPAASSKIRMGVTTEVIGQCGSSAAPKRDAKTELYGKKLCDLGMDFQSMAEYLELLEQNKTAVNVIPFVGHGNLRSLVMGYTDREPTSKELDRMGQLLVEAMQQGAFGMSTGLIYPPGEYAKTVELVELSKHLYQYNGLYATHMRNEKRHLLKAIDETLTIGREAQIPVHISHFKVCDEDYWGLVKKGLEQIDKAREEGLDVTLDQYPYLATSTGLRSLIPSWAHDGGDEALMERLQDKSVRKRIVSDMQDPAKCTQRMDKVMISSCKHDENLPYQGMTIQALADLQNKTAIDACLDLLIADELEAGMVRFAMCEDDVKTVMQHRLVMIGSDGSAMAASGPLSAGKPHPRAYGTFARVLAKYVFEEKLLPLETAIYKMTGFPASRFQLHKRGLLKEGMYADITIFDPKTIRDEATFINPHQYASGIQAVLVNGQIVVDQNGQRNVFPGKVLKRNRTEAL